MRRRAFIGSIAVGLAVRAMDSVAQRTRKLLRVGYLTPTERAGSAVLLAPFIESLRARGYVEGETIQLELRTAEGDYRRLPSLATELAQSKVDVIVAASPPAILAASRATKTIPIVMAFWGGEGLTESRIVASFAHPGGNVTGVYMLANELEAKRLELLLQALPKSRRIAVISRGRGDDLVREVRDVAATAKVELLFTEAPGENGYRAVFEATARDKIDAVMVPSFPRFALEYEQIVAAAAATRIPTIYEWGYMARAGGLMAYGASLADLQDRVAEYVSRILRGARPADMPVEQPTRLELIINLKTAKALELTIPQGLLLRADEVIQ
jgi:putative ABC transport system substrate-binding protein